jgi:hypothetical protein
MYYKGTVSLQQLLQSMYPCTQVIQINLKPTWLYIKEALFLSEKEHPRLADTGNISIVVKREVTVQRWQL